RTLQSGKSGMLSRSNSRIVSLRRGTVKNALQLAARALAQTCHAFHALPLPDRDWKTIEPGLKKLYRQNRMWMKRALSSDKDEDFHEWRKRVKYYFYLLKMLTPMCPADLGKR